MVLAAAAFMAALTEPIRADLSALEAAGGRAQRRGFTDLAGWTDDQHASALVTFKATCGRTQAAFEGRHGLTRACEMADSVPPGDEPARLFFEREFDPVEIAPAGADRGFLTGYFEPELAGSIEPDATYAVPLLAPPADLVGAQPGEPPPGWPEGLAAARRTATGFEPYPDRAAIADGVLGAAAQPVVHVADPVDAFMVQVQGSARVRLRDGRVVRVGYAGRNGHPYTSIGRVLAEQEGVPPSLMTADLLVAWLKANPERAPAIMRRNRSFVFFRLIETLGPADGPVGAAGASLTPGRSLAVDFRLWPYGMPVWIEADLPAGSGGTDVTPVRRLVVAQDTGTAIVGPARGDLYFGSGAEAGERASLVRHPVRWIALLPKASSEAR